MILAETSKPPVHRGAHYGRTTNYGVVKRERLVVVV
jgi:hypothetical protein